MNRLLVTIAALSAASSMLRAATYQWNGNSGDASSSSMWTSNVAPASADTDQLLFPGASAYSVNFDNTFDPWTVNTLTFSSTAPTTINASNTQGIQLSGTNPTINQNGMAAVTINAPLILAGNTSFSGNYPTSSIATNAVTIASNISGTGSLTKVVNSPALIYQSTASPTFSGGTMISGYDYAQSASNQTAPVPLVWNYAASTLTSTTSISFGTGNITLDRGDFFLMSTANSTPANQTLSFTNNILVTPNGGRLTAAIYANSTVFNPSLPSLNMTGNVSLAGMLVVGDSGGNGLVNTFFSPMSPATYSGTITLDQSSVYNPVTSLPEGLATDNNSTTTTTISGNIIDDPSHTGQNPLTLLPSGGELLIAGTNNTYSHGTIIGTTSIFPPTSDLAGSNFPSAGMVAVALNSRLGTGNVTLNGGTLQLSALANLSPGEKISGNGTLSITFDADPTPLLSPDFSGFISLDSGTFSTPLNLATLPHASGPAWLGSIGNTTYTAVTLGPDASHVFHLGSYGAAGSLAILHGVLTDSPTTPNSADLRNVTLLASNSYSGGTTVESSTVAAATGALGTGNITVTSSGNLSLTAPNAYSPAATLTVFGTLSLSDAGSIPASASPPIFLGGSNGLIFGKLLQTSGTTDFYPDTLPLNLNGTSVNMYGSGSEQIGALSISGANMINFRSNGASAILAATSFTRNPSAIMSISYDTMPAASTGLQLGTFPPLINGMLPPYITVLRDNTYQDFATLSNNTIVPIKYVQMPSDGGHGTEVVEAENTVTLASDISLYALVAFKDVLASGPNVNLSIRSGGLTLNGNFPTIDPNLDFSSAEAIIRTSNATFNGSIYAPNGLIFAGYGAVQLNSLNNQISGPITCYATGLRIASIGNASDTSPILFTSLDAFSSSFLSISSPITTDRPIDFASSGYIEAIGNRLTTHASITATGDLTLRGSFAISGVVNIASDDLGNSSLSVVTDASTDSLQIATIQCSQLTVRPGAVGANPVITLTGPVASRLAAVPVFQDTSSAHIDMGQSALVLQASDAAAKISAISGLRDLLHAGSNNGIISSSLYNNQTLALIDNANTHFTSFAGQPVNVDSILITPELIGDYNLDGVVDLKDLQAIANHWQQNVTDWSQGDVDNNGKVDLIDLQAVANHWQAGVGSGGGGSAESLPDSLSLLGNLSNATSTTPEPSSLLILGLTASAIMARRKTSRCN